MKVTKKARKELKDLIRKTFDGIYGFPEVNSPNKLKFINFCAERIADYFEQNVPKKRVKK